MIRPGIATLMGGVSGVIVFLASVVFRNPSALEFVDGARTVIPPAAMQVLLSAGDRYLAANYLFVRALMSGGEVRHDEASFRVQAHVEISSLNPCHEGNYWVGNSEMTWGGSSAQSPTVLIRAMECRTWDAWPAFFYGFNRYFFQRDVLEARRAFEIAAQRADEKNAAAFRALALMLVAREIDDVKLALDFLRRERDSTRDLRLVTLIEKRIGRLEGLVALRDASNQFHLRFGRNFRSPNELVQAGILAEFPTDPLGIGYVYEAGEFKLRELRSKDLEALR